MDVRNFKTLEEDMSLSLLHGLCFHKTTHTLFSQNHTHSSSSPPPVFPHSSHYHLQNPQSIEHSNRPINGENLPNKPSRREMVNFSILTLIISSVAPFSNCKSSWAETEDLLGLERYTDSNEGFTLLRPTDWVKVEKAGATVLFEDRSKRSNNLGVVVTPVRLTNLRQFGDPQFVANKLIQAEKRKESTKMAELISFEERPGRDGDIQVYEFEYTIDSTRGGLKKIFSAAFVASKKLYLLNIAYADNVLQPLDKQTRTMLQQVLHSFDVAT